MCQPLFSCHQYFKILLCALHIHVYNNSFLVRDFHWRIVLHCYNLVMHFKYPTITTQINVRMLCQMMVQSIHITVCTLK